MAVAGGDWRGREPERERSASMEEPEAERLNEVGIQAAARSVIQSEQLDGTIPSQRATQAYEPFRQRLESIRWKPYEDVFYILEEEEREEEPEEAEDEWKIDRKARQLIRVHRSSRSRIFRLGESRQIREQLKKEGKESRVLPSRLVRRWKTAEQPGAPPSRKSQWCVRGDKDPDLLANRYAPTVTTAVVSIALQVAAKASKPMWRTSRMPSCRVTSLWERRKIVLQTT